MKKTGLGLVALVLTFALVACSGDSGGDAELESKSPDAGKAPVAPAAQKNLPGANSPTGGASGTQTAAEKPEGY